MFLDFIFRMYVAHFWDLLRCDINRPGKGCDIRIDTRLILCSHLKFVIPIVQDWQEMGTGAAAERLIVKPAIIAFRIL